MVLGKVGREDLMEKGCLIKNLTDRRKEAMQIWEKRTLGGGTSKCKGPEA